MKKTIKRTLFWVLMTLLVAVLSVGCIYTVEGYRMYREALEDCSLEQKVAELQGDAHYTRINQLPKIYKNAVIAAEDHRFYSHGGVDPVAILRAVWTDLRTWSLKEGGSTITQQLAKNFYFPQSRKLERKIAELFMARAIEKAYEKDEILDLYINCIYYGSGYYCIFDASIGYFGKAPEELSDYECTLLAGLPNAPSVYDPTVNPHLAIQRQAQVLEKMVRYGYLTEEQAEEIKNEKQEL